MTITKNDIQEMTNTILAACERRNWNPYDLNHEQLKEIITVVLGTPLPVNSTNSVVELKTSADNLIDFQIDADSVHHDTADISDITCIRNGRDKH